MWTCEANMKVAMFMVVLYDRTHGTVNTDWTAIIGADRTVYMGYRCATANLQYDSVIWLGIYPIYLSLTTQMRQVCPLCPICGHDTYR